MWYISEHSIFNIILVHFLSDFYQINILIEEDLNFTWTLNLGCQVALDKVVT